VFAPDGRVPLAASGFPLGYGCSGLDFQRVNVIVKKELESRGVTETTGPGLVKYCKQDGEEWILGVMAQVGKGTLNRTIPAPEDCQTLPGSAPKNDAHCQPSGADVARLIADSGQSSLHFEVKARASEVVR
jgi:hypothetical protein